LPDEQKDRSSDDSTERGADIKGEMKKKSIRIRIES
jgi:translation initiation factor IF-1